jgi:hypothetical protein
MLYGHSKIESAAEVCTASSASRKTTAGQVLAITTMPSPRDATSSAATLLRPDRWLAKEAQSGAPVGRAAIVRLPLALGRLEIADAIGNHAVALLLASTGVAPVVELLRAGIERSVAPLRLCLPGYAPEGCDRGCQADRVDQATSLSTMMRRAQRCRCSCGRSHGDLRAREVRTVLGIVRPLRVAALSRFGKRRARAIRTLLSPGEFCASVAAR